MNTLEIIGLALAPVVALPAFWCAIVFLLSRIGGWQRLAQDYAADTEPDGARFTWQSGRVGLVSYKNCLAVVVSPQGLFVSMPLLFRVGHQPLLIPWHAIRQKENVQFLFYKAVKFQIGSPPVGRMELPVGIFEAARPWLTP